MSSSVAYTKARRAYPDNARLPPTCQSENIGDDSAIQQLARLGDRRRQGLSLTLIVASQGAATYNPKLEYRSQP